MEIEQLIKEYGTSVYNYALRLSCHPKDAEDLMQETFINAWRHLEELRDEGAVRQWLHSICYRQFLMKIRKTGRYQEELVEEFELLEQEGAVLREVFPGPEDEILVEEEIKELQNGCFLAMVRKLTLNQRIMFSLVDMYGMSIKDAACLLDISVTAAKGLLYRARMNIDSFYSGHCNLLNMQNPCSCKAWIAFAQNRESLQSRTKELVEALDYREKNYRFSPEVRRKIKYLYANMPEKKPGEGWYQRVIDILK